MVVGSIAVSLIGTAYAVYSGTTPTPVFAAEESFTAAYRTGEKVALLQEVLDELENRAASMEAAPAKPVAVADDVHVVPFYSQFADISMASWQKVACGIASVAMIIDFYGDSVLPDVLLDEGIARGAYLTNAGWTHAGLIGLAADYGLSGSTVSLAHLSTRDAFYELEQVMKEGPVMVSVHYTFDPSNPIPHLVVVNGVKDGRIYYNDPAEGAGGGHISIEQFKTAWKKRYIEIRPTV